MLTSIKRVLNPISKIGLWLGIDCLTQHLTGNSELTHWMATAGVGVSNVDDVCNIVDSLTKKRISDYWKDFRSVSGFGVTQHVQLAFQTALKAAPKLLARNYGRTLATPLTWREMKQVLAYFQSLSYQLITYEFPDDLVEQYVYDRSTFITTLLTGPGGNAYVPDLSSEKSEQLTGWVTAHFEKKLGLYLYEVFKTDDKAKTA